MGILEELPREATSRRRAEARSPRFAVLILCALVAVSLGVNAYLIITTIEYFRTATAIRLDPGGLEVYSRERGEAPPGHPLLVLFGDSRIAMWPDPVPPGYRVLNRGVGHQTTAQLKLRLEADVLDLHPDVVVLEAGVNDLNAIAEFPSLRAQIVSDCEANLAFLVRRCTATGATVVLVTVFDIGDVAPWRRPFWSDDVMAAVREVNAFLPQLISDRVVLFDANPALRDGHERIPRAYQVDYLHITPAGYGRLNQALLPILSALAR